MPKYVIKSSVDSYYICDSETKEAPDVPHFARCETERGYHYIFDVNHVNTVDACDRVNNLQDKKFALMSRTSGYWAQFTHNKHNREKREMILIDMKYRKWVEAWNYLATFADKCMKGELDQPLALNGTITRYHVNV
jgi:hypothetical protein